MEFCYTTIINPAEGAKSEIINKLKIDAHTLDSALDPDELARIELDPAWPDYLAIIFKIPRTHSASDSLNLNTTSVGILSHKQQTVVVCKEQTPIVDLPKPPVKSLPNLILRLMSRTITTFREHLRMVSMLSDELQKIINISADNKHLVDLFTLQKSLVYYLTSIGSNGLLLTKIQRHIKKLGFSEDEIELFEDIMVENDQCYRQAEIASNILASLMDARASVINNNIQLLMKGLTIVTIAIMLPTLVVSAFSMNVPLPCQQEPLAFYLILTLALLATIGFVGYIAKIKWLK
jgi:magnesium transporter